MTQIYKVIKPLELGGKNYRLGEEVALTAREAEKLMNTGFLANTRNGFPDSAAADAKKADKEPEQSRDPNPEDPKDKEMVADAEARKEAKHTELQQQEAEREEAAGEREAEKDEKRLAKMEEAKALAEKVGREDIAAIEAMTEEQLDKEIKEMQGVEVAEVKEEKTRPKTEAAEKTK